MAISLFMAILFGPSGIDDIIIAVFDMFSPLQLIIFAEAGPEATQNVAMARIAIVRIELSPKGCWPVWY
jgi:hypothetical protein